VRITDYLLEWKSSDSVSRKPRTRLWDPLRWLRETLYQLNLVLTSPTGCGSSFGIVCLRTKTKVFSFIYFIIIQSLKCARWVYPQWFHCNKQSDNVSGYILITRLWSYVSEIFVVLCVRCLRDKNKRSFSRPNEGFYLNHCRDYTRQISHTLSRSVAHKLESSSMEFVDSVLIIRGRRIFLVCRKVVLSWLDLSTET
jgi:hypothetical protein